MESKIIPKVFGWMFIGLIVTFLTGYVVYSSPQMIATVFSSGWFIGIIIAELALVIFLSARITKMSPTTAKIAFLLYSFVSGLTFSTIFITYNLMSIMFIFLITAALFGMFAAYGYITKKDLSGIGSFLIMAILGTFLCILLNLFFQNETFDLIISIVTVLIFVGFTAYDIQRIKKMNELAALPEDNLAIYGALELYLDFINIFIELLNLFGRSSDN